MTVEFVRRLIFEAFTKRETHSWEREDSRLRNALGAFGGLQGQAAPIALATAVPIFGIIPTFVWLTGEALTGLFGAPVGVFGEVTLAGSVAVLSGIPKRSARSRLLASSAESVAGEAIADVAFAVAVVAGDGDGKAPSSSGTVFVTIVGETTVFFGDPGGGEATGLLTGDFGEVGTPTAGCAC